MLKRGRQGRELGLDSCVALQQVDARPLLPVAWTGPCKSHPSAGTLSSVFPEYSVLEQNSSSSGFQMHTEYSVHPSQDQHGMNYLTRSGQE